MTTNSPAGPGSPGYQGIPGRPGMLGGGRSGAGGPGGPGGAGGRGGSEAGEPGGRGGAGGEGGAGRNYNRDGNASRALDWIVRIVAVLSFVLGGFAAGKVFNESQCQGRFSQRATALAPATTKERDTQRAADNAESQLWLSVKPGDQTAEQRAKVVALFATYQTALVARNAAQVQADKARAANPLPTCSPATS